MRVSLPIPSAWPRNDGVSVSMGPVEPMPPNAVTWAERQVLAGAQFPIRVRSSSDKTLAGGWSVTLIESDVIDGERVVERRLHALYQFVKHGAAGVARGPAEAFDARRAELEALLLGAVVDLDDVVALSQVWDGLSLRK